MHVSEIMKPNPATVGEDETLATLMCLIPGVLSRLLYVVDKECKLVGLLSSYDILKYLVPDYLDSNLAKSLAEGESMVLREFSTHAAKTVGDIMTRDMVFVRPDHTVLEAQALIKERGVNVLPVVDKDGQLVGEVSRREILNRVAFVCCNSLQPKS